MLSRENFAGGIPEWTPVLSNHNVVQVPITNSQKVGGNAVPHRSAHLLNSPPW